MAFAQISIWDYVRYGANAFLGEILLELGNHPLDDEAEWYTLHGHFEANINTVRTPFISKVICRSRIENISFCYFERFYNYCNSLLKMELSHLNVFVGCSSK